MNQENETLDVSGNGEWVTVAMRATLSPGNVICVVVGERHIAVYNCGGEFYATSNICTHGGGSLNEGRLDGDMIICPLHRGCFDIKTGKGLGAPIQEDLKTFPTRLVGDDIQVWLSASAPDE